MKLLFWPLLSLRLINDSTAFFQGQYASPRFPLVWWGLTVLQASFILCSFPLVLRDLSRLEQCDEERLPEAQSLTLQLVLLNPTSHSTLSCMSADLWDSRSGSQIVGVSLDGVLFWLSLSTGPPNLCYYVTRWHFPLIINAIDVTSKAHTMPGTPTRSHCVRLKIQAR